MSVIIEKVEALELRATLALQKVLVNMDKRYQARVWNNQIELKLFNDEGWVFGSGIELRKAIDWQTQIPLPLKIGAGSLGSFDLTCEASVAKTIAMADMVNNFDLLDIVVGGLTVEYINMMEDHKSNKKQVSNGSN